MNVRSPAFMAQAALEMCTPLDFFFECIRERHKYGLSHKAGNRSRLSLHLCNVYIPSLNPIIEEYCDPRIVWQEIENDRVFFSIPIEFEGGFELPALIAGDTSIDTWRTMWMPRTFHQLTRIRNSLVHGRERRQNIVILPTPGNTRLIERYLPVIRRVAEQIALSKV